MGEWKEIQTEFEFLIITPHVGFQAPNSMSWTGEQVLGQTHLLTFSLSLQKLGY